MRFLLVAILALAWGNNAWADWQLRPLGSTRKLLASKPNQLEAWTPVPVQLDCVRGEHMNFQFVISATDKPIESLSIAPTTLATFDAHFLARDGFQFFRENFVYVPKPSGNRIKTPKWWPDALIPFSLTSPRIEPKQSAVFWASFAVPADAAPGDYFGELDIDANGQPKRLALTLHVRPMTLPPSKFRGTVALYYDSLREWYRANGNTFSQDEWAKQKRRYADFLLDFGLNPYDPPVAWKDAKVDDYLRDPRVHSLRTPPLDAPDFAAAIAALQRTGTLAKAFYYWNDEPQTVAQFEKIRADAAKLRAWNIPQLVTHHPTPELESSVGIWCPNISNALGSGHLDIEEAHRQQKAGRPTWLYTMVVPKHPYPTWLLDDDSSAIESYAPLWSQVGASGFVYSMCHGWGPKPLESLESFQNTNGDGTLLYPAELVGGIGPMPSIRLMLLRDAIEDLALWNEAKQRNLAPQFSFPVQRTGALIYDRTALLDALETGKTPPRKFLPAGLWPEKPTSATIPLPYSGKLGAKRRVQVAAKSGVLAVRVVGPKLREEEAFVVVLARLSGRNPIQTRWAWDAGGKLAVSQRTNSLPNEADFPRLAKAARFEKVADGFGVTMPLGSGPVRFNVWLRSPNGTIRLFPDGSDPFAMPILRR